MACNMQLRRLAVGAIRSLPRAGVYLAGQRHFVRCICPAGHNLIPTNNKINSSVTYVQFRSKWKRRGQMEKEDEDSESDSDEDAGTNVTAVGTDTNQELEPGAKIITYKMDTPRIDRLVRKALNLSVKQVEELFYDKKIFINDEVLLKKSEVAAVGDLITIPLEDTPGKIKSGALLEILDLTLVNDNFMVKISRNKNTQVSVP